MSSVFSPNSSRKNSAFEYTSVFSVIAGPRISGGGSARKLVIKLKLLFSMLYWILSPFILLHWYVDSDTLDSLSVKPRLANRSRAVCRATRLGLSALVLYIFI